MLCVIALILLTCTTTLSASSAESPPRRLIINGSTISEPESPLVPTKLRGFNFWVALDQPIESMDKAVTTLLPGTNMARLVMVHWQDAASIVARGSDCYAATHPFIKTACLKLFDDAVAWATGAGLWTILTGRAKGDPAGHVFNDDTLVTEMVAMWSFLAARYANVSNILGYEVFSEPRTLNATQVHNFHVQACGAVWSQDPLAACLIGAGKFYDRYQLDERFIIKDKPVIYAANYLTPKRYTKGTLRNISYPGSKIQCGALVENKEIPHACPDGDGSAVITFNKDFLRTLAEPFSAFKNKYNVPLWVDQWGVFGGGDAIGGGNASVTAYMEDALDLWDQGDLLWTQWIWRSPYEKSCTDYSLVCQPGGDTCGPYYPQVHLLKPLSKYLGGSGGGGGPLPTPLSPLCNCINDAKAYCATAAASACKKCVFQHKTELVAKGCDWATHSQIVAGACPAQEEPRTDPFAHGLLPHVREYGSPAAYAHAVASNGDSPGTYVKYDWPPAPQNLSTDMEVDHVWTTIPSGNNTHGNGVFASSQYWYHDAVGNTVAGGYMGSQVMRTSNGTERRVFIFSCWDSDSKLGPVATVGWTTPETCSRFGGEGVGSHCILDYPTLAGRLYNFRVAFSGSNETGATWTGTVTDTVTGASTIVGTLFYPHVGTNVGFGSLGVFSNEFLEYFLGGDCDSDVRVAVGTVGPYFHQRSAMPTQAYPQYGSGTCNRTSVINCIPGQGCGRPRVFVQGGKGVQRNNSDTTKLWPSELGDPSIVFV